MQYGGCVCNGSLPPSPPPRSVRLCLGSRPAEGPAAWQVLAARIVHRCDAVVDDDVKLSDVTRQLGSVAKQNHERVPHRPSAPPSLLPWPRATGRKGVRGSGWPGARISDLCAPQCNMNQSTMLFP
jgi:hypothetical protein